MSYSADASDYKTEEVKCYIQEGRAKILSVLHIPTKKQLIAKVYNLDLFSDNINQIKQEAHSLRTLQHPNLCSIITNFCPNNSREIWLLLPSYTCCAHDLIEHKYTTGLPELAIAIIVRDILQALHYLHSRFIIHRAVQGRHILISKYGKAVLSGLRHSVCHTKAQEDKFSTCHLYPENSKTLLSWISPEILQQDLRGYSFPSDVYSVGLTVCELANGEEPYGGMAKTLMMVEKLRGLVPYLRDCTTITQDSRCASRGSSVESNGGLQLSNDCNEEYNMDSKLQAQQDRRFSDNAHMFVRKTLVLDPTQRPTVSSLINSDQFVRQSKKCHSIFNTLQITPDELNFEGESDGLDEKIKDLEISSNYWKFS